MNPPKRTRAGRRGRRSGRKPATYEMTAPGMENLTVAISADAEACCKTAARAGCACSCSLYDDGEDEQR